MTNEFERIQLRDSIDLLRYSGLDDLLRVLRRGVYHLTSVQGYRGIRRSGEIQPNEGSFPYTYPQSATSYARLQGYVSLFDFETPTISQCLLTRPLWDGFFIKHKPATLLISLDRKKLAPKLIPNDVALQVPQHERGTWLRHVEVWYPGPIPFGWVVTCILVLPTQPIGFSVYNADDEGLKKLEGALDTL